MAWVQKDIRNHYLKGIKDFTFEGLAPPPDVVATGELPGDEAVSQLMTLHEDCLRRVRTKVPGFDATLADLGPDVVLTPLLVELSDFFGVPIDDIRTGFDLRDDPDSAYDRKSQPRLPTGELDMSLLEGECDAEFDRNGWGDRVCTVDGYANPYDPRLAMVRSRVALRSDGIGWVTCLRPQNFQVARFDSLRLIHLQSSQWCLEFEDWRRRRIADRQNPQPWAEFLDQLRQLSGQVGFEWTGATKGRRAAAFDTVLYETVSWTRKQRAALTRSLVQASIPHDWDGSELRVLSVYKKRVDLIIESP
jgi:hypothetical protein